MSVRHRYTTWQELDEYMGDRMIRGLGWNNTKCCRNEDGNLTIRLHFREIIQLRDDGIGGTAIRVKDSGFPTYVTQDRINLFVPAHWYCQRAREFLTMVHDTYLIHDEVRAGIWSSWLLDTDQGQVPRVDHWPVS